MIPATDATDRIDRDLRTLRDGAARWAALDVSAKAALLRRLRDTVAAHAEPWSQAGARAKGVAGTPLEGEEWISGPWAVLYAINRYFDTLCEIATAGSPRIEPSRVRTGPGGGVIVDVFPVTAYDRILLNGVRAEVRMQSGVTRESLPSTAGAWYRTQERIPRVSLVLGAGNISSIAPLDVLYKLVADGSVCMLKMNPVNDYLGPILESAFAPLIAEGYLRFAYGGAETGKYLCAHPDIDDVHITGSDKTHDAIVFGDGGDSAERKRRNDPALRKPITSELGNVSPTIVVPGPWSDADIAFQAENIVTQKLHNGGFNCIASQVLILPADWNATPKLIDAVSRVLENVRDRPAYYPGAAARHSRLTANRADARFYGRSGDGFVPRTLLRVEATEPGDAAFRDEAFGSVLAFTSLRGNTATYLARAVAFANESLWGTLGANLIAHPATMREHAAQMDAAIDTLRYGCVGVNAWTGVGYFISECTWGAYPGHVVDDIQSGAGVVHNSHLFSRAEKSVVHAPFAPFPRSFAGYGGTLLPRPPWFVTNAMAAKIGRALCEFESRKTPLAMARVAALAMRG
ncbi:MAG TPA: aldehyde dehydrogenase family protein [Candidatus Baltobacteraceae bacterium]|jgi:aldehyde dehydrogenase (NAD(P)+)|nr:aldehyde dehydrogenase family protein [Candidatus Baltobacteraceae bacterium]